MYAQTAKAKSCTVVICYRISHGLASLTGRQFVCTCLFLWHSWICSLRTQPIRLAPSTFCPRAPSTGTYQTTNVTQDSPDQPDGGHALQRLRDLFSSGKYSDLTIGTWPRLHVHKAIVCVESSTIAKICSGDHQVGHHPVNLLASQALTRDRRQMSSMSTKTASYSFGGFLIPSFTPHSNSCIPTTM